MYHERHGLPDPTLQLGTIAHLIYSAHKRPQAPALGPLDFCPRGAARDSGTSPSAAAADAAGRARLDALVARGLIRKE